MLPSLVPNRHESSRTARQSQVGILAPVPVNHLMLGSGRNAAAGSSLIENLRCIGQRYGKTPRSVKVA